MMEWWNDGVVGPGQLIVPLADDVTPSFQHSITPSSVFIRVHLWFLSFRAVTDHAA
jgi:hypothetical protein